MKFPNSIKDANSIILRSRCHICCTWNYCDSGKSAPLIIVRATKVVAALGADQLAMVAGEAVAAGGANLAVMLDIRLGGLPGGLGLLRIAGRLTM